MIASFAFLFACKDEPEEEYVPDPVHIYNENLQYFGYYHSDGNGGQSYFDELQELDNNNILIINPTNSAATACNRLAAVKARGKKALISTVMFTSGVVTVPNTCKLIDNYEEIFLEFVAGIQEYIDDGTVYAFYFDEPIWNGINTEDFRTVTKLMRETCPTVGVFHCMTIFDLGVDKYPGFNKLDKYVNEFCTDVAYDDYSYWDVKHRNKLLWALKGVSPDDAKIWGIATGSVPTATDEDIDKMIASLEGMYYEARWDPAYVGILMFTYPTDGDWFGSRTFITPGATHYSRELRKTQIDYGRLIIGKDPIDWNTQYEIVFDEPISTYNLGDEMEIPASSAYNIGTGEALDYTITLTTPDGQSSQVVRSFDYVEATQSGIYTCVLSAQIDGVEPETKTINFAVKLRDQKGVDEVSTFESVAYLSDALSTGGSLTCWPRLISGELTHNDSKGALKVIPHSTDGDWMHIFFAHDGNEIWDFTDVESISMWVYVTGNEAYTELSLGMRPEAEPFHNKWDAPNVYMKNNKTIQPNVWTEVTLNVEDALQMQKDGVPRRLAEVEYLISKYAPIENMTDEEGAEYIRDVLFADEIVAPWLPATTTKRNIVEYLSRLRREKTNLEIEIENGCTVDLTKISFFYANVNAKKRYDYPDRERNIFYIDDVTITYKTK